MAKRSYLLSATGEDRRGFVAAITKKLFDLGCNLEDSSMMLLGGEFAMFVMFSSTRAISLTDFSSLRKLPDLSVGLKSLSAGRTRFKRPIYPLYIVRVHGPDHPGIVYRVSKCLADHGFNITDLSTHQTTRGKRPGYILLIEGELPKTRASRVRAHLQKLQKVTKTRISFDPLPAAPL